MKRLAIGVLAIWGLAASGAIAGSTAPAEPALPPTAATASAGAAAATPAPVVPKLSNFADLVVAGIVGENAPLLAVDFASGIALGAQPLVLEKTTLSEIKALMGGTSHSQGDPGSAVSWLCYTRHAATKADTPRTVWFISTSPSAPDAIDMVVVENVDATKVSGCLTAPKTFVFPSFGIPGIGASLADIKGKFGVLVRDRQHNVYYNSARALNDGSGRSVYQKLGYRLNTKGVVSGIALSQVTTD